MALNCTNLTQPEDKLRFVQKVLIKLSLKCQTDNMIFSWIFNVFDEDAGGFIDAVEVEKLVVGLLQLTEIEAEKENIDACVEVGNEMNTMQ